MAENVIFNEQEMLFTDLGNGLRLWQVMPSAVSLTNGETYRVEWNDMENTCVAFAADLNGVSGIGIGNTALAGLGDDTGEPFLLGVAVDGSFSACYTMDANENNSMRIYHVTKENTEEPDEPEAPKEGIVLKDRNGNDVAYYGIETVTFDTTTDGKQQTFTKGVAVEGLEIVPDFSGGDMPVTAPEGSLVRSAVVKQPAGLTPGNIRNGAEVAGVVGSFIGDTEVVEVDLAMADGDQEITPSDPGKVLRHVVVKKPETLVPDNILEGVNIAGIVGTLALKTVKIATGYTKGNSGTFTHNLGVVPDIIVAIYTNDHSANTSISSIMSFSQAFADKYTPGGTFGASSSTGKSVGMVYGGYKLCGQIFGTYHDTATDNSSYLYNATETTVMFNKISGNSAYVTAWIAIGGLT